MNNLQIFNFENKEVRTVIINDEPWFVGKDIADILGYINTKDALIRHVDDDDKQTIQRSQNTTLDIPNRGISVINESGLYSLILSSKLPQAKEFKKWVTSEVLPSIRKHGAYMTEQTLEQALTNPDFLIKLATELKEEQQKRKELELKNSQLTVDNQIMQPKADYFDELVDRNLLTNIRETAKELQVKEREFV